MPLAYAAGLADGYELGRADENTSLVDALAVALGGDGCHDYRAAVRRHHRTQGILSRRQSADDPTPRPGDYPGRAA